MLSTEVRHELSAENNPKPAKVPYFPDVESLTAEHGAALCSLASIILVDRAKAEEAVSHLLSHSRGTLLTATGGGIRQLLSRRLYLNCTWARLISDDSPERLSEHRQSTVGLDETAARLSGLSEQHRAALALFLYGNHTYQQVAELISLPEPVVFSLLNSGLEKLRP